MSKDYVLIHIIYPTSPHPIASTTISIILLLLLTVLIILTILTIRTLPPRPPRPSRFLPRPPSFPRKTSLTALILLLTHRLLATTTHLLLLLSSRVPRSYRLVPAFQSALSTAPTLLLLAATYTLFRLLSPKTWLHTLHHVALFALAVLAAVLFAVETFLATADMAVARGRGAGGGTVRNMVGNVAAGTWGVAVAMGVVLGGAGVVAGRRGAGWGAAVVAAGVVVRAGWEAAVSGGFGDGTVQMAGVVVVGVGEVVAAAGLLMASRRWGKNVVGNVEAVSEVEKAEDDVGKATEGVQEKRVNEDAITVKGSV